MVARQKERALFSEKRANRGIRREQSLPSDVHEWTEKTPLSFVRQLPLFVVVFFIAAGCSTGTIKKRVPWESGPPVETRFFLLHADPQISAEEYAAPIENAQRIVTELRKNFFPEPMKKKISLILYKNQFSYSRHRRVLIDSVADFERRRKRINISIDAPESVWKHELSHALLELARPGTPFWLHEGLALLIQDSHFSGPITCDGRFTARMPESLERYLPELRTRRTLSPDTKFNSNLERMIEFHTGLAGYFVLFLWHEKRLVSFLKAYQHGNKDADRTLTHGNPDEWKRLVEKFQIWLKSDAPRFALPGC